MITTTATPLSPLLLEKKKTFKDSKINYGENNYMKNIFDTNNIVNIKHHNEFKLNCISTLKKDNKTVDSNYPLYNSVHTPYVLNEKNIFSGQIPKEVMGLQANEIEKELNLKNNKKTILTSVQKFEEALLIAEKNYKKSLKNSKKNSKILKFKSSDIMDKNVLSKSLDINPSIQMMVDRNKQRKMDYTINEGTLSGQDTSDEIKFNQLRKTFTIIRKKEKDSLPVL
jgi:hypothetical protein